jgi:hypothetical protein
MEERLLDCDNRTGVRFELNAFDQAKRDVSRLEKENELLRTQLALQQEKLIQPNRNIQPPPYQMVSEGYDPRGT